MFVCQVILLPALTALTIAIEFSLPTPYSFGYAVADKHGEQHRQEVGDGLHKVTGSYGFKDEKDIERQVNYVADKGGLRAAIKSNEPGTAHLNPAGVKMEASAYPYLQTPKATGEGIRYLPYGDGYSSVNLNTAKEVINGRLAKGKKFSKEALIAKLLKSRFAFRDELALPKETGASKGVGLALETMPNPGFEVVPAEAFAKELIQNRKRFALDKSVDAERLAKWSLYSPLPSTPKPAVDIKEAEALRALDSEKMVQSYATYPMFSKGAFPVEASLPHAMPKLKGFVYGGPLKGGFVTGYDARYY